MSLRLFSWAMSLDHIRSPQKFVLLAMAEAANDNNVWQGNVQGIHRFTNLGIEEIREIRAELWDLGLIYGNGLDIVLAAPMHEHVADRSPSFKKKPIPMKTRMRVMGRDGFKCQHCGSGEDLTIDHIHPESKGGSNDIENLQVLCRICNCRKGVKVPK